MDYWLRIRLGRRSPLVLLAAALLVLVLSSSSARAASPSSQPSEQLTLKIGITTEPDSLNPFVGWANVSSEIFALNYSFLFRFGVDEKPSLDLASEFPTKANGGISADGKTWTIHLRSDARWSDGRPVTAEDVAFTYNYDVKNHMSSTAVATQFIKAARVVNPTTVQIVCSRPKANMEYLLVPILPKHVWEHVSASQAGTDYANSPPIVGSGPFQVTEWKHGKYVRLTRNPYYWGTAPALDEVLFVSYKNPETMTSDLQEGSLDAAWGIPSAQFSSLTSASGIEAVAYPYYYWGYLNFNCYTGGGSGNPVLRDARFRQALNYAVDRDKLCSLAFMGLAEPGTTIMPPNSWSDPDYHWQPPASALYEFDLARANSLLDAAGYRRGSDGIRLYRGKPISLRLWATTDNSSEQVEAKLITGWLRQLGLKVQFSVVDLGTLYDSVWTFDGSKYTPDFDMYVCDWQGYLDPGQTLACQTTAQIGSTNEPCWSNAEYDELNAGQASSLDPVARQRIIWRMQQIMYEETPWVVLNYPYYLEAYNTSKWTGWTRVMFGKGPAFLCFRNVDSYVKLQPAATTTTERSSSLSALGLAVAAGAVIAVVVVVLLIRRTRRREVEE